MSASAKDMTGSALAARLGQEVVKYLLEAVRKDRANRYSLLKPWTLPQLDTPLPDYEDELFSIRDAIITVKPYAGDICDGASLAPDRIGSWKMVIGSLFHDPWYHSMSGMSKAWDLPVRSVRRYGDCVFYSILILVSPGWIARTYYRIVRSLGGGYHFIAGAMAVAVVMALCSAGCSGCAAPDSMFDDPSTFTLPEYEQSAGMPETGNP